MTLSDLPALNAMFNFLSLISLISAYVAIRNGRASWHKAFVGLAFLFSASFLTFYLYYHAHAGHVVFGDTGWVRTFYLSVLISHSILAVVILPLIALAVFHGVKENHVKHRKVGRVLMVSWVYVSATGILIYFLIRPYLPVLS